MILEGGGHAMAGGFQLKKNKIKTFCDYIEKSVIEELIKGTNLLIEAKKVMIDSVVSIPSIRFELLMSF